MRERNESSELVGSEILKLHLEHAIRLDEEEEGIPTNDRSPSSHKTHGRREEEVSRDAKSAFISSASSSKLCK